MDMTALGTQLKDLQSKMSQYGSELPGQIKEEVRKAWSPSLQEASNVVGQKLQGFLPSYFGMADQLGGTSAADISPTARLTQMGNYLGELGGGLSSAANYGDYLGANMKSAYEDALNAMKTGYGNLSDQYGTVWNQYQLAAQQAEAAKDRALQERLARMSGGGGSSSGSLLPGDALDKLLLQITGTGGNLLTPEALSQLKAYGKTHAIGSKQGVTAAQRKAYVDQLLGQLRTSEKLPSEIAYRLAGFSNQYNPALSQTKWWE